MQQQQEKGEKFLFGLKSRKSATFIESIWAGEAGKHARKGCQYRDIYHVARPGNKWYVVSVLLERIKLGDQRRSSKSYIPVMEFRRYTSHPRVMIGSNASWYVNHVTGSTGQDLIAVLQLDSYPDDLGLSVFRQFLVSRHVLGMKPFHAGKRSGDAWILWSALVVVRPLEKFLDRSVYEDSRCWAV